MKPREASRRGYGPWFGPFLAYFGGNGPKFEPFWANSRGYGIHSKLQWKTYLYLGHFWPISGGSRPEFGPFRACLGGSWSRFEPFWAYFGGPDPRYGPFGPVLGSLDLNFHSSGPFQPIVEAYPGAYLNGLTRFWGWRLWALIWTNFRGWVTGLGHFGSSGPGFRHFSAECWGLGLESISEVLGLASRILISWMDFLFWGLWTCLTVP